MREQLLADDLPFVAVQFHAENNPVAVVVHDIYGEGAVVPAVWLSEIEFFQTSTYLGKFGELDVFYKI